MEQPIIHVGILSDEKINFDFLGTYYPLDSNEEMSGKCTASIESNNILVNSQNKTFKFESEVIFEPDNYSADSFMLRGVLIGIKFHWEQQENQRFMGSLKLLKENQRVIAINLIPVEEYLLSVISSEMKATSSIEFLKAHAIISRSWLLAQIDKGKELKEQKKMYLSETRTDSELIKWYDREDHLLYDVCADDHCQRYQGITKAYTEKVRHAVEETKGLVLMYNNKICDARFSKSCGGISESFENVWEPVRHPYLSSIVDYKFEADNYKLDFSDEKNVEKWIRESPKAFCNTTDVKILSQVLLEYDQKTTDFFRWKIEYTQQEISEIIRSKSGTDFGQIKDLIPLQRGYSGRLIKLAIVGTEKTMTVGKELEIRKILSHSHLYSAAFIVEKKDYENNIPGKFILYGAGWGHGVGLCQIGAAVMGEMGYKFDEILLHYFREAKIKKIY